MAKSAAFGAVHLVTSFGVGYLLTGSVAVAGALTIVEPACNTVAHYFFDRWWDERHAPAAGGAAALSPAGDWSAAPAG
jgi:uncharacterized membrane protein